MLNITDTSLIQHFILILIMNSGLILLMKYVEYLQNKIHSTGKAKQWHTETHTGIFQTERICFIIITMALHITNCSCNLEAVDR